MIGAVRRNTELGLLVLSSLVTVGAYVLASLPEDGSMPANIVLFLGVVLGLQAFIIMAGVVRLMPLTGVTLPFVSYGGSSLLANFMLLAVLMRISDEAVRREEDKRASLDQTHLGALS